MQVQPPGQAIGQISGAGHGSRGGARQVGAADHDAPLQTSDATQGRGVIRLLRDGHFQGVADVRLRINFAPELGVIQAQAQRQALQEGAEPFLSSLEAVVDEFLAGPDLDPAVADQIDQARELFRAAAQDLFAAAGDTEFLDTASLADSLESAFQEFLESLQALVPVEPPEPAEDGAVDAVEAIEAVIPQDAEVAESITGFAEFLTSLEATFASALQGLHTNVSSASALPPVSDPNGNGVAYARFLEILHGLGGGSPEPDSPQVDTAA